MSTIADLIAETNAQGAKHPLFKQMSQSLGRPITSGKDSPKVTVLHSAECAVVFMDDEPVGLLTIDWGEPCLIFKPLKND